MAGEGCESGLVERAAAGDTVALTQLLTASRGALGAYVAVRLPAELQGVVDADDIVQETYVEVFRHIGRFKPEGAYAFERWLATIAIRKLHEAVRRRRALKRGGGAHAVRAPARRFEDSLVSLLDMVAGSNSTPSRVVGRREAGAAMEQAIGELPPHYAEAIRLVYLEGCSVAEAAERMGRTDRAIHGLCRRGLKLLHGKMGSASMFLSRTR
ncbi:MAG: RNA polymerase sigma factor [Phycisphaerae bacterium]